MARMCLRRGCPKRSVLWLSFSCSCLACPRARCLSVVSVLDSVCSPKGDVISIKDALYAETPGMWAIAMAYIDEHKEHLPKSFSWSEYRKFYYNDMKRLNYDLPKDPTEAIQEYKAQLVQKGCVFIFYVSPCWVCSVISVLTFFPSAVLCLLQCVLRQQAQIQVREEGQEGEEGEEGQEGE